MECAIITNHVHSQAPAVVCDGCYRLAMTSIQEGEDSIDCLAALLTEARSPVQALAMDGSVTCADLLERIDQGLAEVAA